MTGPWTHEHRQHASHEEVTAVVCAETHERPRRPVVSQLPVADGSTSEPHRSGWDVGVLVDQPFGQLEKLPVRGRSLHVAPPHRAGRAAADGTSATTDLVPHGGQ